jgi:hypothetical protein
MLAYFFSQELFDFPKDFIPCGPPHVPEETLKVIEADQGKTEVGKGEVHKQPIFSRVDPKHSAVKDKACQGYHWIGEHLANGGFKSAAIEHLPEQTKASKAI